MTAISTLIRDAYRESNLIPISADPTTNEAAEALRLINRFVLSLFGNEAGDPLTAIPLGRNNINRPSGYPGYGDQPSTDWFVPANSRLILNLTSSLTVYLDPRPSNGARFSFVDKSGNLATKNLVVNANGYTIDDDTTATFNTNSLANDYFFRQDTGNWALVSPLAAADESPFPEKFDDLLIVGLAMRLNPRNGIAADGQSVEAYRMNLRKFRAEYGQDTEMPLEEGLLRTLGTKRRYFRNDNGFTIGRPR